MKKLSNKV